MNRDTLNADRRLASTRYGLSAVIIATANHAVFGAVLLSFSHIALAAPGDRQPGYNYVFPDDVFLHNGGRVIDVTQPPFNANPEAEQAGTGTRRYGRTGGRL